MAFTDLISLESSTVKVNFLVSVSSFAFLNLGASLSIVNLIECFCSLAPSTVGFANMLRVYSPSFWSLRFEISILVYPKNSGFKSSLSAQSEIFLSISLVFFCSATTLSSEFLISYLASAFLVNTEYRVISSNFPSPLGLITNFLLNTGLMSVSFCNFLTSLISSKFFMPKTTG